MKELIPRLVALIISGSFFMVISIKFNWSTKIWSFLNKKVKPQYNAALYIIFGGIFNLLTLVLLDIIGLTYNQITNGVILGLYLAFIPNLGRKLKE